MCHASISRNCVQSHLICNGHLTLLIITYLSLVAVPAPTNPGIPFRRWICKDTLIRVRCKCKRDICQGGVVGYPRGLWILRPGSNLGPGLFFSVIFLITFTLLTRSAFPFISPRLNWRITMDNTARIHEVKTNIRIHEPYPD